MVRRHHALAVVAPLLAFAGCSEPGDPSGTGGALVDATGGGTTTGGSGGAPSTGGDASVGGSGGSGSVATGGSAPSGGAGGSGGTGGAAPWTCATRSDLILCEDFESTMVGETPESWTSQGEVGVVAEGARGTGALRIGAAANGPRRITRTMTLPGTHWGRVFYRVETPPPAVFVHSTLVELAGNGPNLGEAWYRVVDTVQNAERMHQFLFNVQPASSGEYGKGSAYDWAFSSEWQCAEWHVDGENQRYRFFLGGEELTTIAIDNGPSDYGTGSDRTHLPSTFSSVAIGWYNYQSAAPGFVAWLDDFALGAERIGCE